MGASARPTPAAVLGRIRRRLRAPIRWFRTPTRWFRAWISWLFQMPASLFVTLLIAVMTVVVGPALVRQWDDRQRARDLKAATADQIVIATVRTLNAGVKASQAPNPTIREQRFQGVTDSWDAASIRISLKMRAYFPNNVINAWFQFKDDINVFLVVCKDVSLKYSDSREASRRRAIEEWVIQNKPRQLDLTTDLQAASLLSLPPHEISLLITGGDASYRTSFLSLAKDWMQTKTDEMTAVMLTAHPAGFSITRSDLLRDMVP
jgi:hypothetical protein